MKILDLFCGAGGAGEGYRRAGFDVTGVDLNPKAATQNPGKAIVADAVEYALRWADAYDAIHASPPCQPFSTIAKQQRVRGTLAEDAYPDLIAPIRAILEATGLPYVIENVPGAPLIDPVQLCGSSFGLDLRRHRLFEANFDLPQMPCNHSWQTPRFRTVDKRTAGRLASVVGVHGHVWYRGNLAERKRAMGIHWMKNEELVESIPPAYTEYIGNHLAVHLERKQDEPCRRTTRSNPQTSQPTTTGCRRPRGSRTSTPSSATPPPSNG